MGLESKLAIVDLTTGKVEIKPIPVSFAKNTSAGGDLTLTSSTAMSNPAATHSARTMQ